MLGNLLALYKARKDPNLAKSIASEMVVDGTIDRFGWPLLIAKLWMGLGILGLSILTALFIWIGASSHWGFAAPALLFSGLIYVIIRVWRGLNRGVETIKRFAKSELNQRVQKMSFPQKRTESEKHPEE